jgi:hypothetical protein
VRAASTTWARALAGPARQLLGLPSGDVVALLDVDAQAVVVGYTDAGEPAAARRLGPMEYGGATLWPAHGAGVAVSYSTGLASKFVVLDEALSLGGLACDETEAFTAEGRAGTGVTLSPASPWHAVSAATLAPAALPDLPAPGTAGGSLLTCRPSASPGF